MNYMDNIDQDIKEYFNILEPEFPNWLNDYINIKELQKQKYISVTCGTIYSDLFESEFFFSSLDHSIAVALIIWHFTHDKKQTLAGLFHDIATPTFKHWHRFLKWRLYDTRINRRFNNSNNKKFKRNYETSKKR